MKNWLFTAIFVTSASAMAGSIGNMGTDADSGPTYLSWCTKENKIASQSEKGQVSEIEDCVKHGQKCQELHVTQPKLNHIYAVCK